MNLASSQSESPESDLLNLLQAFVERGRTENVWKILRYYGYDTALELEKDFLEPKMQLEIRNNGSELVEFSDKGWEFLEMLWREFADVRLPSATHN